MHCGSQASISFLIYARGTVKQEFGEPKHERESEASYKGESKTEEESSQIALLIYYTS